MIYAGQIQALRLCGKSVSVSLQSADGGTLAIALYGEEIKSFYQQCRPGHAVTLWCREGKSRTFLNSWAIITAGLTDSLKEKMDRERQDREKVRQSLVKTKTHYEGPSDETRHKQIADAHAKYPHLFTEAGSLTANPLKKSQQSMIDDIPF